jgi:hypothetical protein
MSTQTAWRELGELIQLESWPQWNSEAGSLCLHSMVSSSPARLLVGISAGGVFRSDDAGRSWGTVNQLCRRGASLRARPVVSRP